MHAFAIDDFDATPRATAYMQQQITMVQQLQEKEFTYIIP
jgi:cysteinyl-tRNA synthetase